MTGTGPMGCVPAELAMRSRNGECAVELQRATELFNPQLLQMLNGLNSEIGQDVFIAANTGRMHMDFISNPRAYGIYLHTHLYIGLTSPSSMNLRSLQLFFPYKNMHGKFRKEFKRCNQTVIIMTTALEKWKLGCDRSLCEDHRGSVSLLWCL